MKLFNILLLAIPLLAATFILISPAKFGLQTGNINKEGRYIFFTTFITLLLFTTGGILTMKFVLHNNPYSGAGYEVVIISPIIEELIFRGILFHLLFMFANKFIKSRYNVPIVIVINSILFGSIHFLNILNPQFTSLFVIIQVVQSFLLGIIYCFLRYKSDSIYPAIFLHFLWNFIATKL